MRTGIQDGSTLVAQSPADYFTFEPASGHTDSTWADLLRAPRFVANLLQGDQAQHKAAVFLSLLTELTSKHYLTADESQVLEALIAPKNLHNLLTIIGLAFDPENDQHAKLLITFFQQVYPRVASQYDYLLDRVLWNLSSNDLSLPEDAFPDARLLNDYSPQAQQGLLKVRACFAHRKKGVDRLGQLLDEHVAKDSLHEGTLLKVVGGHKRYLSLLGHTTKGVLDSGQANFYLYLQYSQMLRFAHGALSIFSSNGSPLPSALLPDDVQGELVKLRDESNQAQIAIDNAVADLTKVLKIKAYDAQVTLDDEETAELAHLKISMPLLQGESYDDKEKECRLAIDEGCKKRDSALNELSELKQKALAAHYQNSIFDLRNKKTQTEDRQNALKTFLIPDKQLSASACRENWLFLISLNGTYKTLLDAEMLKAGIDVMHSPQDVALLLQYLFEHNLTGLLSGLYGQLKSNQQAALVDAVFDNLQTKRIKHPQVYMFNHMRWMDVDTQLEVLNRLCEQGRSDVVVKIITAKLSKGDRLVDRMKGALLNSTNEMQRLAIIKLLGNDKVLGAFNLLSPIIVDGTAHSFAYQWLKQSQGDAAVRSFLARSQIFTASKYKDESYDKLASASTAPDSFFTAAALLEQGVKSCSGLLVTKSRTRSRFVQAMLCTAPPATGNFSVKDNNGKELVNCSVSQYHALWYLITNSRMSEYVTHSQGVFSKSKRDSSVLSAAQQNSPFVRLFFARQQPDQRHWSEANAALKSNHIFTTNDLNDTFITNRVLATATYRELAHLMTKFATNDSLVGQAVQQLKDHVAEIKDDDVLLAVAMRQSLLKQEATAILQEKYSHAANRATLTVTQLKELASVFADSTDVVRTIAHQHIQKADQFTPLGYDQVVFDRGEFDEDQRATIAKADVVAIIPSANSTADQQLQDAKTDILISKAIAALGLKTCSAEKQEWLRGVLTKEYVLALPKKQKLVLFKNNVVIDHTWIGRDVGERKAFLLEVYATNADDAKQLLNNSAWRDECLSAFEQTSADYSDKWLALLASAQVLQQTSVNQAGAIYNNAPDFVLSLFERQARHAETIELYKPLLSDPDQLQALLLTGKVTLEVYQLYTTEIDAAIGELVKRDDLSLDVLNAIFVLTKSSPRADANPAVHYITDSKHRVTFVQLLNQQAALPESGRSAFFKACELHLAPLHEFVRSEAYQDEALAEDHQISAQGVRLLRELGDKPTFESCEQSLRFFMTYVAMIGRCYSYAEMQKQPGFESEVLPLLQHHQGSIFDNADTTMAFLVFASLSAGKYKDAARFDAFARLNPSANAVRLKYLPQERQDESSSGTAATTAPTYEL